MLSVGKMETMTRVGFAARGIMYFLIGYLALEAGRAEDGAGALSHLDSSWGKLLLGIMALGFLGYGIWRLSEAVIDTEGHGSDAKGAGLRVAGAVSAAIHLGLALTAATLALGGGSSASGSTEEKAATALSLPGGQTAMSLVAAVLVVAGLYQLLKALKGDLLKHLDREAARQAWVTWVGRAGYAARGIVFAIMGVFLWQAARSSDASQAGDMGEALSSLPSTLQMVVAAGLILFGVFSLLEARYRRINDPHVLERLKGAAA